MMITTHSDESDSLVLDEILLDQGDMRQVLAESGVNLDNVDALIQRRAGSGDEYGARWVVVGGIETFRRLNLPSWAHRAEMMLISFTKMGDAIEQYRYSPD